MKKYYQAELRFFDENDKVYCYTEGIVRNENGIIEGSFDEICYYILLQTSETRMEGFLVDFDNYAIISINDKVDFFEIPGKYLIEKENVKFSFSINYQIKDRNILEKFEDIVKEIKME